MKRLRLLICVSLAAFSGCSIVKSSMVRDDWKADDATKVKRLAVVVRPAPVSNAKAGEAWARIARRYVNQKRDFLVKKELVPDAAPQLQDVCGGEDAIEGVLFLEPAVTAKGDGFEVDVKGKLARCGDGRESWAGEAAGSFPAKDPLLVEVTQVYVKEFGAEVEPLVAPAMNVLRPLLDTLPQPTLTEADVDEKLTLD